MAKKKEARISCLFLVSFKNVLTDGWIYGTALTMKAGDEVIRWVLPTESM